MFCIEWEVSPIDCFCWRVHAQHQYYPASCNEFRMLQKVVDDIVVLLAKDQRNCQEILGLHNLYIAVGKSGIEW